MRFRQMGCVLDRGGPFTLCVLDRWGAYDRHVVLLTEWWCFYTMRFGQRGSTLNPDCIAKRRVNWVSSTRNQRRL